MPRFRRPTKEEIRERRREIATRAREGRLRFPDDVHDIRMALGKTQDEFAALLGLTRRQVAEIESGQANPTYETIMKIGRLFGFRLGFVTPLLESEDKPPRYGP
jgi:putative transcriptional regulator